MKASVFIDGASRGNPGPAAVGVVFEGTGGKPLGVISKTIGVATNNTAEYYALILALQQALMLNIKELNVFTDSELVARQFAGRYKIKDASLKLLYVLISHLKQGFSSLEVVHVPREENKRADEEANRALDQGTFFL